MIKKNVRLSFQNNVLSLLSSSSTFLISKLIQYLIIGLDYKNFINLYSEILFTIWSV